MSVADQDSEYMRMALALAAKGRGSVEPNPMVGAVVVRNGAVVGSGYHERLGGPHAEVAALAEAGERARGATLYVTLEPCAHQGRTPPCAPRVAAAGVARVVTATLDPTPKTRGRGTSLLREHGVRVESGVCREDAVRLNAGFFKIAAVGRPLVIAKWAMSADGKIATRTGDSRWISSDDSRGIVHAVRGVVDCIIVGGATAVRDDPLLTCRGGEKRRTAARLVLCGRTAPPSDGRLTRTAREVPVLLAYPEGHPPDGLDVLVEAGCEPLAVRPTSSDERQADPAVVLDLLGEREMTNVLVEGGARTLGSFMDGGLVDRVMAFVAPVVVGGEAAPSAVAGAGAETVAAAVHLRHASTRAVGSDALIEGWVSDPLTWAPDDTVEPTDEH